MGSEEGAASVFESPAVVAGLDDVAMVGQAIQQCGGHLGAAEHRGPLREVEVGGDDNRGALVSSAVGVRYLPTPAAQARQRPGSDGLTKKRPLLAVAQGV